MRLIRVAVPVPALEALTYHVPDELGDPVDRCARPRAARQSDAHGRGDRVGTSGSEDVGARTRAGSSDHQSSVLDVLDARVSPAGRRRAGVLGLRVLRVRRGRSGCRGDAPARVGRERALRADHGRGRSQAAHRARGAAGDPRGADRREARRGSIPFSESARGSHAALLALERDGLVEITRPLKGKASAYRTVRVATLSAQGHDVAEAMADLKVCATDVGVHGRVVVPVAQAFRPARL